MKGKAARTHQPRACLNMVVELHKPMGNSIFSSSKGTDSDIFDAGQEEYIRAGRVSVFALGYDAIKYQK